ncbi:hypothetical protein V6N13_061110 [Hibiscus sabdariffa]
MTTCGRHDAVWENDNAHDTWQVGWWDLKYLLAAEGTFLDYNEWDNISGLEVTLMICGSILTLNGISLIGWDLEGSGLGRTWKLGERLGLRKQEGILGLRKHINHERLSVQQS